MTTKTGSHHPVLVKLNSEFLSMWNAKQNLSYYIALMMTTKNDA